jgi:hypothetical protein
MSDHHLTILGYFIHLSPLPPFFLYLRSSFPFSGIFGFSGLLGRYPGPDNVMRPH